VKCEEALEWIQRELDGDLTPEEQSSLRRHLSICTGCAAEAERFKRLSDDLSRLPRVTPPHSLVDRLIESGQLPGGEASGKVEGTRRRFAWWLGSGAAAAVLLIGFAGLWAGWFEAREPDSADNQVLVTSSEKKEDASSPSENMTMSAPENDTRAPSAWSPDGRFRAEVEGNRVVVRTADGKEKFRSKPWKKGSASSIQWVSPTSLRVEIAPPEKGAQEVRIIDVEAKREDEEEQEEMKKQEEKGQGEQQVQEEQQEQEQGEERGRGDGG